MFKCITRNVGNGIKRFMEGKVQVCKEVPSAAENRLILGLIFVGLGGSLIGSAYIRV